MINVAAQHAIALNLGQQNAVGHHLHQSVRADRVGEANRVTDGFAELRAQLVGDSLGDGACRDSPRLCVTNQPIHTTAQLQAQFGKLCALSGTRFTGDDHNLVVADRH